MCYTPACPSCHCPIFITRLLVRRRHPTSQLEVVLYLHSESLRCHPACITPHITQRIRRAKTCCRHHEAHGGSSWAVSIGTNPSPKNGTLSLSLQAQAISCFCHRGCEVQRTTTRGFKQPKQVELQRFTGTHSVLSPLGPCHHPRLSMASFAT